MRTTLLATISALALMSAPALAGGTSSQAAGGGGTSTGAAGQSDTGSSMQSGGGSTTGAAGQTGTTGSTTGVTGSTGPGGASKAAMSEDQIRSMLEAEGYTDVSNLQQQGDMFQAQAMKDGEEVTVMIDPSTGEVMQHE